MEIIAFIVQGVGWAVNGGWRKFMFGYLTIIACLFGIGFTLIHWITPLEQLMKTAGEKNVALPWCLLAFFAVGFASVILAFGMKGYLVVNPPAKPLWDAKLRT